MSKRVITFYDAEKAAHEFPILTPDYGTCSTAANISEKAVVCADFSLFEGAEITVNFENGNTAAEIALNINESGAQAVVFPRDVSAGVIVVGSTVGFVYDGAQWLFKSGCDATIPGILGSLSVDVEGTVLSLPSSAGKALRDYKIYGNSVQDGEPSIETPAILQSVGDYNETTGKYDVTVGVGGANLLDWESNTEYAGVSAIEFDGKQCIKWLNDGNAVNQRFQQGSFKENTQYTFQLNLYFVNGGYVLCVYTDGSQDYINVKSYTDNEWNHKHFVSAAGKTVSHWQGTHNGGDPIYLDVETSQIIEGVYTAETIPPCIPYREPVTTTISLGEPLRKVGDVADYIDYTGQKIVRQVEVLDDTGTLPLEESYFALDAPVDEPIELPTIGTDLYDNVITVDTEIQPSNVKVTYFKKSAKHPSVSMTMDDLYQAIQSLSLEIEAQVGSLQSVSEDFTLALATYRECVDFDFEDDCIGAQIVIVSCMKGEEPECVVTSYDLTNGKIWFTKPYGTDNAAAEVDITYRVIQLLEANAGRIETLLDEAIALQEAYIGGGNS